MDLLHESIAEIDERSFIARVMSDAQRRSSLFGMKGLSFSGAAVHQSVQLHRFRRGMSGDIDILVVPDDSPERATAIQVKRFKVGRRAIRSGKPNGLGEFRKGVKQANQCLALGFHQVYLWIFVLVDTREQNGGRLTYDGIIDPMLTSRITQVISTQHLHPRVGLASFEWVQPMDRPPLETGTYGGHLRRLAIPAEQNVGVTEWVKILG